MSKYFNNNSYYRWLGSRGEIYIKYGKNWTFVESGQLFKGDFLNNADNYEDEIEFGCAIKWVEMPSIKLNISEHKLNEIVNTLTMEQCFDLLPNPGDNDNVQSYYPIINKVFIENNGRWNIRINDWYGSKDQITIFEVSDDNLLNCLHSAIIMIIVRGIISIDKFTNRLHDYGINEI